LDLQPIPGGFQSLTSIRFFKISSSSPHRRSI
jgi:hypothetical protein